MFIDYDLELLKKIIDTQNNNQVILAFFLLVSKEAVVLANMNLIKNSWLSFWFPHNGMILSTFSISSRGFPFGFPKIPHTNGDVLFTYKSMINPFISRCGTHLPMILNNPPLEQRTP